MPTLSTSDAVFSLTDPTPIPASPNTQKLQQDLAKEWNQFILNKASSEVIQKTIENGGKKRRIVSYVLKKFKKAGVSDAVNDRDKLEYQFKKYKQSVSALTSPSTVSDLLTNEASITTANGGRPKGTGIDLKNETSKLIKTLTSQCVQILIDQKKYYATKILP